MEKSKGLKRSLLIVFGLCFVTVVLAEPSYIDQSMMDWDRGDAGSTWQEWTFDDADNPAAPEYASNPGSPLATITGQSGSAPFQWNALVKGREGVWSGDPVFVNLFIPNFETDNPVKKIWFEMDYRAVEMLNPVVQVDDSFDVETVYYDSGIRYDDGGNVIDDWRTMVIGWEITPNPSFETIQFALAGTGGFVDRISVDTICVNPVPAPGAMLLSGIGVMIAGYLKRRENLN